jgi:hypothetical protein
MTNFLDENSISLKIDEETAKELARRLLGQYYSVVDAKAVLEDQVWLVTAYLGFSNTQTRRVRIDANSGKILGYT